MTTLSGTAQPASAAGLARHLPGRVIGPDSPDWDTARRPRNRRAGQRPLVVADAEGSPLLVAEIRHLGGAYDQPPQQPAGPGAIGHTDA